MPLSQTLPTTLVKLSSWETLFSKPRTVLSTGAFFGAVTGCLAVLLDKINNTNTVTFRGKVLARDDIFKQQEYLAVAVVFLVFQTVEAVDVCWTICRTKKQGSGVAKW